MFKATHVIFSIGREVFSWIVKSNLTHLSCVKCANAVSDNPRKLRVCHLETVPTHSFLLPAPSRAENLAA